MWECVFPYHEAYCWDDLNAFKSFIYICRVSERKFVIFQVQPCVGPWECCICSYRSLPSSRQPYEFWSLPSVPSTCCLLHRHPRGSDSGKQGFHPICTSQALLASKVTSVSISFSLVGQNWTCPVLQTDLVAAGKAARKTQREKIKLLGKPSQGKILHYGGQMVFPCGN